MRDLELLWHDVFVSVISANRVIDKTCEIFASPSTSFFDISVSTFCGFRIYIGDIRLAEVLKCSPCRSLRK